MTPGWTGLDATAQAAFAAGFGIAEYVGAFVFVFLLGWVMLRKLLALIGW